MASPPWLGTLLLTMLGEVRQSRLSSQVGSAGWKTQLVANEVRTQHSQSAQGPTSVSGLTPTALRWKETRDDDGRPRKQRKTVEAIE